MSNGQVAQSVEQEPEKFRVGGSIPSLPTSFPFPVVEYRIARTRLLLARGDIVLEEVEAIVNAANTTLLGGGGVDGAIHRAGGPAILEECRGIGGCATGDAVITGGGRLPARHVVHTVGPVWSGGDRGEERLLASAYRRSLEVAAQHGVRSLAFPSISTGAYRFPIDRAAEVALGTVRDFLAEPGHSIEEARFVLFSDLDLATYAEVAARVLGGER